MNTVKWGVLSTANIAQTQLIPALKRAENAEIIAIASRGEKVHEIAERLGILKAYESYEALLTDPDVETIYIPLPNNLHKEWVIRAAKTGKHILCEKPVALHPTDLEEMITACNVAGVQFMEAFMYQFHPQHARVKEIIASGEIGDVKLYKSSHSFYFENREGNIRMDATQGGGAIWDIGCYSVHAMQLILGKQVKSLSFKTIEDPVAMIDVSAFGIIELEDDIHAIIDCSFDMIDRNEYEIIGTKGTIKVKYAFRPDRFSGNGQIIVTHVGMERIEQIGGDIYKGEVEFFSDAVRTNADLTVQHQYARQNVAILHAIQQSAKLNQKIELD